ncbi:MAG: AmmeMemoRadiSam system protein A [Lachnospiraceae bacterium]|nr:AmmeMemoRadiSam system protein A [Lachnospiraceae bacterium]
MSIVAAFMVPHPPLIIPEVGKGSEEIVQRTIDAYTEVAKEISKLHPDTVIISSPHAVMYSDYFAISPGAHAHGSFAGFEAPRVTINAEYDEELVSKLCELSGKEGFPAGVQGERNSITELDHGTMIPLWFLNKFQTDYKLVRVGLSGLPLTAHYAFGQLIKNAVSEVGRKAVFIASGDLSHKLQETGPYGFAPEGPEYDKRIMDVCGRGAFGELLEFDDEFLDRAAECGHRSFTIMAGALDGQDVRATVLSHEDVTGVGYGICTFYPGNANKQRHFLDKKLDSAARKIKKMQKESDEYVALARQTIETFITTGEEIPVPSNLPKEMTEKTAGAFVSIHKNGKLRGCIGTILPTRDNLAKEIISNAISAATADPRFTPIVSGELPWLDIKVDVLTEPEQISSIDELDVKRYGVIVSTGPKTGLLLPDLEGVDTVEEQVSIALQKGGITEDEEVFLYRFEVIRHT